jgi:hypothetical protein
MSNKESGHPPRPTNKRTLKLTADAWTSPPSAASAFTDPVPVSYLKCSRVMTEITKTAFPSAIGIRSPSGDTTLRDIPQVRRDAPDGAASGKRGHQQKQGGKAGWAN